MSGHCVNRRLSRAEFTPGLSLERFIQIEEKAFVAKTAIGVIQRQVGTGCLIEQDAETAAIARLELLEQMGSHSVIARHQLTEDNSAEEFIVQDGES